MTIPGTSALRTALAIAMAAAFVIFLLWKFEHSSSANAQANAEPLPAAAQSESRFGNTVRSAVDFNWRATPPDDLSSAGRKTVHLENCPAGVSGKSPQYWVYVTGTGKPEAAPVVGGSCVGDDRPGTLEITTAQSHLPGYVLASATGGIQEASISAAVGNIGGNNHEYREGGFVRVGPGQFQLYAPLTVLVPYQTIDFSGSTVVCNFDADCINVGDQAQYNAVPDVTLIGPRGEPTIPHGQHAFIAVWGQNTRIFNLSTLMGKLTGREVTGTFGSYVNVVGDQAFLLDGVHTHTGLECTASFCGTVIRAPGPFSGTGGYGAGGGNAALGWIKNANLDLQCMGNGIDWQSGNNLRISDSVIQGYPQFAVRGGLAKGGYGMLTMENVYMEVGNCKNPLGNMGTAGVIVQGGKIRISGGEGPDWHEPTFAATGKTSYAYYVVPFSERWGYGNPLFIGSAATNGQGNVSVTWPDIPTLTRMDVLKLPTARNSNGTLFSGPHGSGNYAIATGLSREAASCSRQVCSFNDAQIAPKPYSVHRVTYFPFLTYWPAQLVLGPSGDGDSAVSNAHASLDLNDLNAINLWQVNTAGPTATLETISEANCMPVEGSPVTVSCLGSSYNFAPMATLMMNKAPQDGGHLLNLKGRLNFLSSGSGPGHIVTLVDSDPEKTLATVGDRPANDPADAFIGCDSTYCFGNKTGLTFGAPASISNYIGSVGDGKNWKERLTGNEKSFAVPVVIEKGSTLTVGTGSALSQMKIFHAAISSAATLSAHSCSDVKATVGGLSEADQITGLKPPKPLGNLSLNGYASAADTLTLHFCNAGAVAVPIPSGSYSFLAVH